MYKKICTRCTRSSFSSSESGKWSCPSCGYDLTEHSFYDSNTFQNINDKVLPLKKKLEAYRNQKMRSFRNDST
jgi:ribosomal protein L37AE/L43A